MPYGIGRSQETLTEVKAKVKWVSDTPACSLGEFQSKIPVPHAVAFWLTNPSQRGVAYEQRKEVQ